MLAALVVVLLAALIVAGDLLLARPPRRGRGRPARADPGAARPYKVKPPNPGGLDMAGESETAFETSAGEDKDSRLDLSKLPETRGRKAAQGAAEAGISGRTRQRRQSPPQPAPSPSRRAAPAA